jgi:phosphoribosylformimino-5-aminoimidazole carboxamide ribotide isomerase
MRGQVVRGVAGRRTEYRPVQSRIAASALPGDVSRGLAERFGFRTAYVADLDAIGGGEPGWDSYEAILAAGLALWLDAGIGDAARARRVAEFHRTKGGIARLVIGLESIAGPEALGQIAAACDPAWLVFSLDMKGGSPLTTAAAWRGRLPEEIAAAAVACGITSLILLDLAQVGMYQGAGTEALCTRLRQAYPQLQLIGGGGVRSIEDVRRLAEAGFDEVLVASALHDGRITVDELDAPREAEPRRRYPRPSLGTSNEG